MRDSATSHSAAAISSVSQACDSQGNTLVRGIGRWDLVAILINIVIGSGILGLPAKTFALLGNYSLIAWILCTCVVALIALCFAEVGSRFKETGGPYLYAYTAFGPSVGFMVGWLSWVSRVFAYATIMNLALGYASGFAPALSGGAAKTFTVVALTTAIAAAAMIGVRGAALVNNAFTVCKVAMLVGFVAVGLPFVDFTGLQLDDPPPISAWHACLTLMVFAFLGTESALITAAEMRNPGRDVPFALGVGLSFVVLIYILVQMICNATVSELAASPRPLVDAAASMWGPAGGWLVNAGALLTMLGTLFAVMLTGSRLPYGLAERGQLPRVLAQVHPRFHTPHISLLLTAVCACVLALYSSFLGALVVSALTRLIGYGTTCAALVVLRKRDADESTAAFRVYLGPVVAGVATVACIGLMMGANRSEITNVAIIALIGAVIGVLCRRSIGNHVRSGSS